MDARRQFLLILDTQSSRPPPQWREILFSLSCRILLNTSTHPSSIQWSYRLLDDKTTNRSSFIELTSSNLLVLKEKLLSHTLKDHTPNKLYISLALAIQEYPWDAPTLDTPTVTRKRKSRTSHWSGSCHVINNRMYVVSDLFSREVVGGESFEKSVLNVVFPVDLQSQLINKNIIINVIWVPPTTNNTESSTNLKSLKSCLQSFGGNVISLSALLAPPFTPPTDTPSLLLPPETYLNKPIANKPHKPHPPHLLYNTNGTVVCCINVFSLSQSLLPSLYTSNGSLLLVPINVIINRDIPFNHLLLSDAVSCIGVNSNNSNELSISFKKLCVWLGNNKYSLILKVFNKNDDLLVLQPQTSLACTLHQISPIYSSIYDKMVQAPPIDTPTLVETGTESRVVTDGEIFTPVHCVQEKKDDVWSSLLPPPLSSPSPLSWNLMTQWSSLTPDYGIPSTLMDKIKNYHDDSSKVTPTSTRLVEELQSYYSPSLFIDEDTCTSNGDTEVECPVVKFDDIISNLSDNLSKIDSQDVHSLTILQSIKTLVNESCKGSVIDDNGESMSNEMMWEEIKRKVLRNDTQLRDEASNETKRIIQILLHFEFYYHFEKKEEEEYITEMLVQLLRGYSLLYSPTLAGKLLEDIIVPEYSVKCRDLLRNVFDGLMMPTPSCLGSPSSSGPCTPLPLFRDVSRDEEEELECPRSLDSFTEEPILRTTGLARRASLQGPALSRQISISKKSKVDSTSKTVCRRSLFSMSGVKMEGGERNSKGKKRHREKSKVDDVVAMETPVKKQVENYRLFKLQRNRSKLGLDSTEDVVSCIDESPQRSFYSSKLKLNNQTDIQFNTPPYKPSGSTGTVLNKDPSPAVLHSLLHGEWVTPSTTDTTPTNNQTTPTRSRAPLPPQSPDMFSDNILRSYASARTLTYSPLAANNFKTPVKSESFSSDLSIPTTPLRSILKTPDRTTPKRKSVSFGESDESVSIATMCVPLEGDSASMMAYNLSTPTKDRLTDFKGLF